MPASPESLTEALLHAARKAGAEAADAVAVEARTQSINVRAGALEQAERSESIEVGLRVFVGRRQACVGASDTRDETLAMLAERAVAMAREAPEDPHAGLAEPGQLATAWDVAALELHDPGPEPAAPDMQEAALALEAAAMAVPGVTQVQAAADHDVERMHMAATNGFSGGFTSSARSLSAVAIAGTGTGMQRDHDADTRVFAADLRSAEEIGTRAGERAAAMLDAKKPYTGAYPVLFDERVAPSLIGHLLAAINGGAVSRGASWLMNRMGEQVLPEGLSLIDDPLRPRALSSQPFDAEGLPVARRALVEDGILTSWVLDLSTGRKLGLPSTGHARRAPSSVPTPLSSNVALTQGDRSREALMAEMGTGLLVTSMIGSTINPNTGDYSRGASGFWIENGEIAFPVNECTIAGSLPDMMRRIVPANDARPWKSRVVPSLLVEGLILAGN
ncbi:MAG: TldD/PmbA family protein [Roseovarius sp.]